MDTPEQFYWYHCPICNKKLFQICSNTQIANLTIKCKLCKNLITINIGDEDNGDIRENKV